MTRGSVITVRGPVDPEVLGPVMTHEHLFMDSRQFWDPSSSDEPTDADTRFEARFAGLARWDGHAFRDNLCFLPEQDYDLIKEEASDFFTAGGSGACLVDLTTGGLRPSPVHLQRLADDLDAHIVAGIGMYVHAMHPDWVCAASVEQLTDSLLQEAADGIAGTTIRPGAIGEIGTSEHLQPCEERVLQAAARTAVQTGLPMNIHMNPPALAVAVRILDLVEAEGQDLSRVSVSHLDEISDLDYHVTILRRGVITGFDSFGQDGYFTPSWKSLSDNTKARIMVDLIDRGFQDQLTMAQDVCKKHHLLAFGGLGYSHVVRRVVPRLRSVFGLPDDVIDRLLIHTPRRWLTV